MTVDPLEVYESALLEPSLADWAGVAAILAEALDKRKRRRQPQLVSAASYIVALGGVRDDSGDLRAMDAHKLRPGLVNNRRGVPLDRVRGHLVEAGYLVESGPFEPAQTTVNDVLELIREELSGRPCYPFDAPF
jgi:hypothetical protein